MVRTRRAITLAAQTDDEDGKDVKFVPVTTYKERVYKKREVSPSETNGVAQQQQQQPKARAQTKRVDGCAARDKVGISLFFDTSWDVVAFVAMFIPLATAFILLVVMILQFFVW